MHNSVFDGKPAGRSHSVHSAFCCYYSPSFFFDDDGRGNEVWLNRMLNHLSSQHFTPLVTQLARTLPRTTKLILHKHRKKRAWAQNLNLLLNSRVTNRSFMAVSQLLSYSAKYCAKVILFYTLKLLFAFDSVCRFGRPAFQLETFTIGIKVMRIRFKSASE